MSTSSELPEHWAQRLVERGFVDRRGGDRYSIKALAEAVGLHTSTVSDALRGGRQAQVETIEKIASALGSDVVAWFGVPNLGEWKPPASAAMLTGRQRRAIEELINSMTERQAANHGAATSQAGDPAVTNIAQAKSRRSGPSAPAKKAARRKPQQPQG